MNLFCVKDGVGQVLKLKDVPHSLGYRITNLSTSGQLYFSTKVEAKVLRDFYNQHLETPTHTIGLGPDHMGPHGDKTKFMAYKRR